MALAKGLLVSIKFYFHGVICPTETHLVQDHGDPGDFKPVKEPRGSIQFLLGGRAGPHHQHGSIGNACQVLSMRLDWQRIGVN